MVDGKGGIASTYLVATQNELPVEEQSQLYSNNQEIINKRMEYILEQLNRFMGIKKYRALVDPTGTYIGHIDCWAKFLSSDSILIAKSEDSTVNKGLDRIAAHFENQGYTVFRILCQDIYLPGNPASVTTAAYTNSLILNKEVFVPIAGEPFKKYDDDAIQVYKNALPGYQITGVPCQPGYPWLGTDALHCRTRGVPREVVNNWLESQKAVRPQDNLNAKSLC